VRSQVGSELVLQLLKVEVEELVALWGVGLRSTQLQLLESLDMRRSCRGRWREEPSPTRPPW
jgi:hypothetical protein